MNIDDALIIKTIVGLSSAAALFWIKSVSKSVADLRSTTQSNNKDVLYLKENLESVKSEHKALIRKNDLLIDDIKSTCSSHIADIREHGSKLENHELMLTELKSTLTEAIHKIEKVREENREHFDNSDERIKNQLNTILYRLEKINPKPKSN